MIFLKSLIFLLFNLLTGFLIVTLVRAFLFLPRKEVFLGGKKIPYTPGFLYRKRNLLIKKLKTTLRNYLNDTKDSSDRSKISIWENRVFRSVWEKLATIENIRYLPGFVKSNIRYSIALIAYEVTKQFLRSFVPFLMEKYKARRLIDIVEEKLDMQIIAEFYDKYVYRFSLIFFLVINFFIGLGNMIVYLIIN
ncbi:MAG: hypothetical protein APR54_00815 [Candidatus Cloacimonas sp. SDB]|nr:MAG: hypothetical protein APR54_00815 [Candidatus Cloacimonas sp. SDB]